MDYAKWANQQIDKIAEPKERVKAVEALAERLGMAKVTLYEYLRGKRKFSTKHLGIIAEYSGVESPVPRRHANGAHTNNVVHLPRAVHIPGRGGALYPVLGDVKAGSFTEADLLAQAEPYDIPGPQNPIYPNATPMAWVARGDSMNNANIFDGSILYGVDFQQTSGVLKNDDIVVVEQNRGGLLERSVKAVAIFPDRTEFQPRSTNPIHKPIIYKNRDHDDDVTVRILTVVHGAYNSTGI